MKANAMEEMKKQSEKDLQHCYQQLKIRMERCRGLEENNFEGFHCVIC
jgi:hypothetical protein